MSSFINIIIFNLQLPALLEIKKTTKPEDQGKLTIRQYEMFQNLVMLQMKNDVQKMKMEDVDLVHHL